MKVLRFQNRQELFEHFEANGKRCSPTTFYLVEGIGILYKGDITRVGFVDQANAFSVVFPGDKLFQLKATHGTPLDVSLEIIMGQNALAVDWVGFITEARKNGWWDFQTVAAVEEALCDVTNPTVTINIMQRLKAWILENPL